MVSGCTGFVGKVVLEKILRSLDVKRIFIMVRPRKGTTIEKRIQDTIFSSPVFATVFE
jgi:fatty acyl-CoA reductase